MRLITGLDALHKQLEDAQLAGQALDGLVAKGTFESLKAGIAMLEADSDQCVAQWRDNSFFSHIAQQGKAKLIMMPAQRHGPNLPAGG